MSILRNRRWAWQGTLWGFRAGLGAAGRDGAQPSLLQGVQTKLGARGFQLPKRCWNLLPEMFGDESWWGTVSAGPAARLTPSWLSMLGFELSLPRCGGVWAAQCLNSLMTARGHWSCPDRPRDVPGRKRWGWSCCGAAAKNLSRARGQRGVASPWDINGVLQNGMPAGQG